VTKNRSLIIPAVVLGVLLVALAIVYIAEPASSLPSLIPGHQAGSSRHHVKHGIAALAVGVACFDFAWFQTGPSATRSAAR